MLTFLKYYLQTFERTTAEKNKNNKMNTMGCKYWLHD